ncbi:MAG: hypothetical protein J1E95_01750 [Muribaculaceae bacterium]|nr:hypothetical protein [Muribaculaceae bacterium]
MSTIFLILFSAGILLKVSKALKNVTQSFLYTVLSLLGLVLLFKWVGKPLYRFMVWFGKKMWLCLKWIGNKMIEHFRYRADELYWFNVANSKDRLVYIKEEDFQYFHF